MSQSWDAQCLMHQVEAPSFEFPPICRVYSETMLQAFLPAPMWFSSFLFNVDPKKCINILQCEGLENDKFLKKKMTVFISGELEEAKLTY